MYRKRKVGDLSHALPQELLVMLPESRMLTQLQTLERRIDSTILKKKARARDSLAEYPSMLLNIATTVSFSVTTASASPEGKLKAAFSQKDRYLCLRIYGAIVDPETEGKVDSDEFEGFCQFFKRIVVVFEKDVFPKGEDVIEWVKTDGNCDANGLEIKRKIPSSFKAKNVSARIFFVVDHYPEKFCCSETLDPLESFFGLDFKAVTRSALLRSLWQYIKTRSLLDSDSPLIIHCDEVLQSVFSCDQMFISDIVPKLQDMLEPCQPIEMSFDMVLADETGAQSLDITVEAQAPVDSNFAGWYEKLPDYGSEITQLNESIEKSIKTVQMHMKRFDFLKAFSEDPVEMINYLVANQSRDVHLLSVAERLAEAQKSTSYYHHTGEWLPFAVEKYLQGKDGK